MSYIKNKITRTKGPTKETVEKDEITSKYDMLVFGKEEEEIEAINFHLVVIPFRAILFLGF